MKLYIPPLPPVPEDMKETLIREHPDGLRVVMAEELGSNAVTAVTCSELISPIPSSCLRLNLL